MMGTTVSIPVYDSTTSPKTFLGVAGIDFYVEEMQKTAGDVGYGVILDFLTASYTNCPTNSLNNCTLDALRASNNWTNAHAFCESINDGNDPSDENFNKTLPDYSIECPEVQVVPNGCVSDKGFEHDEQSGTMYPFELWANQNNRNLKFAEKACCDVGREESYIREEHCEMLGAGSRTESFVILTLTVVVVVVVVLSLL